MYSQRQQREVGGCGAEEREKVFQRGRDTEGEGGVKEREKREERRRPPMLGG